jgi:hypothetical protein
MGRQAPDARRASARAVVTRQGARSAPHASRQLDRPCPGAVVSRRGALSAPHASRQLDRVCPGAVVSRQGALSAPRASRPPACTCWMRVVTRQGRYPPRTRHDAERSAAVVRFPALSAHNLTPRRPSTGAGTRPSFIDAVLNERFAAPPGPRAERHHAAPPPTATTNPHPQVNARINAVTCRASAESPGACVRGAGEPLRSARNMDRRGESAFSRGRSAWKARARQLTP